MKTTEHPDLYFTPVDQAECTTIRGGSLLALVGTALLTAAIYEIISDWDNFKAGLAGKPEIPNE